ncbi:MAG: hypothetical protein V3V41_09675 [Candidatus Heimdallarchaeota archaeon]
METIVEDLNNNEEIIVRLSKLEEQISILRNNRNECNQLTKDSISKRNEINEQINDLLAKAKEYMIKRDEFNNQVKLFKKKRKDLQENLKQNKTLLDELVEKEPSVNQFDLRKRRRTMSNLNEKIDKLEWELQTSVLSSDKEKEIIQHLEKLSNQLNKAAEKVHITSQQTQLWKEISSSQKQINSLHTQIIDMAKESQIYHNLMNQNFHKVNSLRKNANNHHKKFINYKKAADNFHRDFLSQVS